MLVRPFSGAVLSGDLQFPCHSTSGTAFADHITETSLLRRQLRRRFGHLPPEAAARVDRASASEIEFWADNVLDAGTLDEVFARNRQRADAGGQRIT